MVSQHQDVTRKQAEHAAFSLLQSEIFQEQLRRKCITRRFCHNSQGNSNSTAYPVSWSRVSVSGHRKFECGTRFRCFRYTQLVLGLIKRRHVVVDVDDGDLEADHLHKRSTLRTTRAKATSHFIHIHQVAALNAKSLVLAHLRPSSGKGGVIGGQRWYHSKRG